MAQVKPITPTLLDTYLTCPRQYMAKYVTREVVFKQNAAAAKGDRIHKSVEDTLKNKAPLTEEASFMQPLVDWCFNLASNPNIEMFVERTLAIDKNLNPMALPEGFKPWEYDIYMYAKADVFFVDHELGRNIIVDWKTGKPKDAHTQSRILSLTATKSTGYTSNKCLWVHCCHNELREEHIELVELTPLNVLFENIRRYETACVSNSFPAIRNGLCNKYCDVVKCEHNGNYVGNK